MSPKCQSCGMPLRKDAQGGGLEADGSRSTTYCSLCYENGAFRHPEFTVAQMQDHCVRQLKQHGLPAILAWLFTRGLPKLDRWQSK